MRQIVGEEEPILSGGRGQQVAGDYALIVQDADDEAGVASRSG